MKNIAWIQVLIAAGVGMVAGVAYGNYVPGVDAIASKLPMSRTKKAA